MARAKVIGKVDLVDNVAQVTELTKENAKKAINAVLEGMLTLLEQSGKVRLASFGCFSLMPTKERTGRNPQTGEPITIPAGHRIGFKISKSWKEDMEARKLEQAKDKLRVHPHKEPSRAKPAGKPVTKPAAKPMAKPKPKPAVKPAAKPVAKPKGKKR
jgi:DNA-binding protein HU-beta